MVSALWQHEGIRASGSFDRIAAGPEMSSGHPASQRTLAANAEPARLSLAFRRGRRARRRNRNFKRLGLSRHGPEHDIFVKE